MPKLRMPWAGDNLLNATIAFFIAWGGISAILATFVWFWINRGG